LLRTCVHENNMQRSKMQSILSALHFHTHIVL
jgi:hypothetical protein